MEEEEPDYQAIWDRLCADAEAQRRACWTEQEVNIFFDPNLYYAAQRRASKAYLRSTLQQIDLADSINRSDTAGYIQRWYPAPTPNGASISFTTHDEAQTFYDECEVFVTAIQHPNCRLPYRPNHVNPPAIWRRALARINPRRRSQASAPPGYTLSSWQAGGRGVEYRSRLRHWARQLRGHR